MAYDFTNFKKKISGINEWLEKELSSVRTGRATVTLLDGVSVDSYGAKTPLNQAASINIEDAKTLRVVPWDKSLVVEIEKGISKADLGVSTAVDEAGVRVIFPDLTTENRERLVKVAKTKIEESKVSLRSERSKVIKDIEGGGSSDDESKRDKATVQKMIDEATKSFDELGVSKEKEVLS
ncbi:MAG: ribosome recycling factor [Candidatus Paceibacteria bacterium]|jgi:ribosome recycling factor